jgi:class 3 adenylate cyclase
MGETRKLAAILVADVVGYSRLAGVGEDRTLSRLRRLTASTSATLPGLIEQAAAALKDAEPCGCTSA